MKPFYVYYVNNEFKFDALQVFEKDNKIFLIESNKSVNLNDIVLIKDMHYDIINNDFYIMIIIDKDTKTITASYGIFSYCHSLYYYTSNNAAYINISLHNLLNDILINPELDTDNISEFINNGFIRGHKTLIKQISKVPALKTIIFKDKIEVIDSFYATRKGFDNYIDNLKLNLPSEDIKITLPLSGGYDSTLLAYLVKDYKNKIALTVGTTKEIVSEFLNANKTVYYLNFPHNKIYSDETWIEALPKIVDMMEGEMFDIGVFLCYFLIDKIKLLNLTDSILITGDGADQVLNKNFYTENIEDIPNINRFDKSFLNSYPKHFFYYLITKKIEWLLRLNNINYTTPFISQEFCDYAKLTTFTERKEEYKAFVKSYVPEVISLSLLKRGGLINEKYFVSKEMYVNFLEIINSPKYKNWFNDNNIDLRKTIYKMYVIFFNYIFIENKSIKLEFDKLLGNLKNV